MTMTTEDWLQLIEGNGQLRAQMWEVDESGKIRNIEEQCPLCALATLNGCEPFYRGSWMFALRLAFGTGFDFYECRDIARAADYPTRYMVGRREYLAPIRQRLLAALNLKERP